MPPTDDCAGPTFPGDWNPDELEANGAATLALVREHFESIRSTPVSTPSSPEEVRQQIDAPLPLRSESFEDVLEDTRRSVLPHLTLWNHPSFHAYFSNSACGAGILADTLAAALNVNTMLWDTSPSASAVEEITLRWVAEMVGYPTDADGVLVNGASLGTLYGLAAARDAALGADVRRHGLAGGPRLRIYTTAAAHSSVDKAAIALGVGLDNLVRVPSDAHHEMEPDALDELIAADRAAGAVPMAVVATDGTTAVGARDPLGPVSRVCRRHGVWLHVDAAYGGLWRVVPHLRREEHPLSAADSVVVNPHKTLFIPMECSVLLSARRGALDGAFRLVPDYLVTDRPGSGTDYMNRSLALGRPFRALKLWWTIRVFGYDGLQARLAHLCGLADSLRAEVDAAPEWVHAASSPLPLLCIRFMPEHLADAPAAEVDAVNIRIGQLVNASGAAHLSRTTLDDGVALRVSIGNIRTSEEDVRRLWHLLTEKAAEACVVPAGAR